MEATTKIGEWKVMSNVIGDKKFYMAWRQTRALEPNEPMSSSVRETNGVFETKEEAQFWAIKLNRGE